MKKRNIVLLTILLATLAIDQISKLVITSNLNYMESIDIIPSFFRITYVRNTGAAWSILEGKMFFFYIVSAIALALMLYYLRSLKEGTWTTKIGIILMISGTLGNLIDRVAFQYVRDFLDFTIIGYNFPVFNVADMCLVIGIGLWVLDEVLKGLGYNVK